jgi:polyferredoxin
MPLVNRHEMLRNQVAMEATDRRLRFLHTIILFGAVLGGLSGAWIGFVCYDLKGALSGMVIGMILGALLSLPVFAVGLLYALASILFILS